MSVASERTAAQTKASNARQKRAERVGEIVWCCLVYCMVSAQLFVLDAVQFLLGLLELHSLQSIDGISVR